VKCQEWLGKAAFGPSPKGSRRSFFTLFPIYLAFPFHMFLFPSLRAQRKEESFGTQCGTDWLVRLSVVLQLSWKCCLERSPVRVTLKSQKKKRRNGYIYRDIEKDTENREKKEENGKKKRKRKVMARFRERVTAETTRIRKKRGARASLSRFIPRIWIHSARQPANQFGHPLMLRSLYAF